jgi:hypothetical protein
MTIEDTYKQSNPLTFWKEHQNKLPCLLLLARRLFRIPVTSAAVERSFSAVGTAVTERRSALDPSTVNNILLVRSVQNILEQKPDFFLNLIVFCFFFHCKLVQSINIQSSHLILIHVTCFTFFKN